MDRAKFQVDFEKSKDRLLKKNDAGESVFSHISQVILKILEEDPKDALAAFEDISSEVKATKYTQPIIAKKNPILSEKATKYLNTQKALFLPPKPDIDEDGQVIEDREVNDAQYPDLLEEARLFEAVGVGFGPQETSKIFLAIQRLAEDPKEALKEVRFFGKIIGLKADYYVAEGQLKEPPVKEEEEEGKDPMVVPPEDAGAGTNKYVYYVCSYPGAPWIRLPDVTPQQLVVARQICRAFTGDLDARIATYPPFPGTERHYLRAQLGRIASATVLAPTGLYNPPGEEEEGITTNEEFEPLTPDDLAQSAGWVHERQYIRLQGRCEKWTPPPPEGEDDDADAEADGGADNEEVPEVLSSVDKDTGCGETPAWIGRLSKGVPAKYAVACLRSVRWPGSVTVGTHGDKINKFANIYIGTGHKYTGDAYTPPPPPPMEMEYDDSALLEQNDPTPEEEFPPEDDGEEGNGEDDE